MEEPLREVNDKEEMKKMATSVEKDLPASAVIYNVLRMITQGKLHSIHVWTPKEQNPCDVSVCILTNDLKMMQLVSVYCRRDCVGVLPHILSTTSFIGWESSPSVFFMSPLEEIYLEVEKACDERRRVRTFDLVTNKAVMFFLPSEGLKNVPSLPEGYTFQSIKPDDLPTVYEVWQYSKVFSFEHFMESLRGFENSAIYFKDGEQDKMVGWILEDDIGAIGKLNVLPEHRRKNLASVLVAEFSTAMKKQGKVAYALVNVDNTPSLNMFKRLGFLAELNMHYHHSYAQHQSNIFK